SDLFGGHDLIMIFARRDDYHLVRNLVNQTMFVRNSTRPISAKSRFERLRLADINKGFVSSFDDQAVDPLKKLLVPLCPLRVLIERVLMKRNGSHRNCS